jgi:hypothetical protein
MRRYLIGWGVLSVVLGLVSLPTGAAAEEETGLNYSAYWHDPYRWWCVQSSHACTEYPDIEADPGPGAPGDTLTDCQEAITPASVWFTRIGVNTFDCSA